MREHSDLSALERNCHFGAPKNWRALVRLYGEFCYASQAFSLALGVGDAPTGRRFLLLAEFDAGLLHFAVGQQPDERFIVKIDNLDAVAPGIVEVAAERRLEF